ncbi:tyrosine-type recombinase/integrase [Xanthomonas sp. NCPPB 2632]|uniref:tyrosine-type recombinase/integrase n=1 Tax=Xanthomonas sp. NCPPB 2632 TaxID=3240912 RepID=UPI00351391BA
MTKAKTKKRTEPGVYKRVDGRPRYEVRIRWTDRDGNKRFLPTVVYPFDPNAKAGPSCEAAAIANANAYAIQEWAAIRFYDKARAQLAESWTLGQLLERLLNEAATSIAEAKAKGLPSPKTDQKNAATCRMLLGLSKPTDTPNHAGFPDLCARALTALKPEHFSGAPNSLASRLLGRGDVPAPGDSVRRLMSFFGSLFNRAKTEWRLEFVNPLADWGDLNLPPASPGRERTLSAEEWEKVRAALRGNRGKTKRLRTSIAIRLAIYTGRHTAARREEVVKLDWEDLDLANATAHLRDTKAKNKNKQGHTPKSRTIPLPPHVVRRLVWIKRRIEAQGVVATGAVFQAKKGKRVSKDSLTNTWSKACERTGVAGARLHDLRHTRITEIGNVLKSPYQVAAISGHDDLNVVGRYYNPKAKDLGAELDNAERRKRQGKKPGATTARTVDAAVEALKGLTAEQKLAALQRAMAED